MSRVWDALKQAEKQRAQSRSSQAAGSLPADSVNRRRTKRSTPPVPLFVYGSDADKHPFHEEIEALNANEGGCLILLETPVVRGQRLFLVNTANQDERECRIVRLGEMLGGKRQVAVEFLRPAPEFWFDC